MNSATGFRNIAIAAAMGVWVIGGCASNEVFPEPVKTNVDAYFHNPPKEAIPDMQVVDGVRDSGVRAAIVSQHTLFPYHFVPDSDSLNELGMRDVTVLATHYRAVEAGQLNVRRGDDTPNALYNARLQAVVKALKASGVNTDKVQVADGSPGGSGGASEDVLRDVKSARTHTSWSNGGSTETPASDATTSTGNGNGNSSSMSGGQ